MLLYPQKHFQEQVRKETSPISTEGLCELKVTPLWCFYMLHSKIWRKVNSHNTVWRVLLLKPIWKKSTIDFAEETVIGLSNHWYKRQMIYCHHDPIMRKAKPWKVSTCRGDSFCAAVIRSSAGWGLYFIWTTLSKLMCLLFFLHNATEHVGAALFLPAKLFNISVAPLFCHFLCFSVYFSNCFCNYRSVQHVDMTHCFSW